MSDIINIMKIKIKNSLKFVALYIVQAGTLWGLLDGYTYFKGDDLKNFLGSYWVLIYIIPLFTTAYIMAHGGKHKETVQGSITTRGGFSPGVVGGNYAVRMQSENSTQIDPLSGTARENPQGVPSEKPNQTIQTKGDYSPGKVEGDYTVEE
jgi:hypothetical protein